MGRTCSDVRRGGWWSVGGRRLIAIPRRLGLQILWLAGWLAFSPTLCFLPSSVSAKRKRILERSVDGLNASTAQTSRSKTFLFHRPCPWNNNVFCDACREDGIELTEHMKSDAPCLALGKLELTDDGVPKGKRG